MPGGSAFTFEPWVAGGTVVAGLVGLAVGVVLLRRRVWRAGIALTLLGLLGIALLAPGLFIDRAVVTDDRLELHSGMWFSPNVHSIRWEDVSELEGTAQRGRRSTSFNLTFRKKAGPPETVPVGDLMKRGPYQKLLAVADAKGIPAHGAMPDLD